MSENKKKDVLKSVLINIGVLLVLAGSMATKGDNLMFFFTALALLAMQTFDIKADPKRIVLAEIMLSVALSVGAVTQLSLAKSFGVPQVFLIVLLLGGVLIIVESLRKYVDL